MAALGNSGVFVVEVVVAVEVGVVEVVDDCELVLLGEVELRRRVDVADELEVVDTDEEEVVDTDEEEVVDTGKLEVVDDTAEPLNGGDSTYGMPLGRE